MTRKIIKYPNPILKKKCQKVEEITPGIKKLIANMKETLEKNQGLGLAAIQVGVLKRVIVIYPHTNEALCLAQKNNSASSGVGVKTEKGPVSFINPKIIRKSRKKITEEEGCLSFPELFLKIKRSKEVEIEALNEKEEKIRFKTKDLTARILQHEIDHLDGILIIDRINFWQRRKIKRLLKKFKFQ